MTERRVCKCDCFECSIKRHDLCRHILKCIERPWTKREKQMLHNNNRKETVMPDHTQNELHSIARQILGGEAIEHTHEVRELKYKLKQANRTIGHQGEVIHRLRGQLAETRELTTKSARDNVRRLEREADNQIDKVRRLEKLLTAEREHSHTLARRLTEQAAQHCDADGFSAELVAPVEDSRE